MQKLTEIAESIIAFINGTLVPLVFAVAFIVFLFGVFRYFFLGGANEEKRREGRQLIIYSVLGFAVMIVVWGLVNLIVRTFGFSDTSMPALPTFSTGSSISAPSSDPKNGAPCPAGQVRNVYNVCAPKGNEGIY